MNDSLTTIKVRKRFIQILLDPMNTKLQLNWLNIGELRVYLHCKKIGTKEILTQKIKLLL